MSNLSSRSIKISKGGQTMTTNSTDIEIANSLADALIYLLKEIDDDACYKQIFKRMNEYLYESYFQRNENDGVNDKSEV
jgi:hypothetical protein